MCDSVRFHLLFPVNKSLFKINNLLHPSLCTPIPRCQLSTHDWGVKNVNSELCWHCLHKDAYERSTVFQPSLHTCIHTRVHTYTLQNRMLRITITLLEIILRNKGAKAYFLFFFFLPPSLSPCLSPSLVPIHPSLPLPFFSSFHSFFFFLCNFLFSWRGFWSSTMISLIKREKKNRREQEEIVNSSLHCLRD